MPFTLTMPKLSPTMEEGTIAKWHVKEGDFVQSGELLFEVSTDKATVEYNALDEGFVRKIMISEGGIAKINQPVAIFTVTKDEKIDSYKPEGIVLETASQFIPAIQVKSAEPLPAPLKPAAVQSPPLVQEVSSSRLKVSPLAKRLAKDKNLDLASIKGSGPGGRVMSRDLSSAKTVQSNATSLRPTMASGTFEIEALTPVRKVIAERLLQAKNTIPHFYVRQSIDAEALINLREQLKAGDIKVTVNDIVLKASALALREHPHVNSGFDQAQQAIIRYKTIDISVAVSIPDGLITPIVVHADHKSIQEISSEVKLLAQKAQAGKLLPKEFQGGSFTISNMGMYGIDDFAAIINPPQAAIIAVSSILDKPVVKGGQVVPGKTMNITLSCDHRVIDGALGASFMQTLKAYLENPALLLV